MEKVGVEFKEIRTVERFCDICGDKAKGRHCKICQRDICGEHTHIEFDEWGGDSTYNYCIQCWKIGESFRRRKSVLSEIYEQEIEDLENAWKTKALEKIAKDNDKNQQRKVQVEG